MKTEPKSTRSQNKSVQVRLTPQQHELIDLIVEAGPAKNKAHFCVKAIENELTKINIFDVLQVIETLNSFDWNGKK